MIKMKNSKILLCRVVKNIVKDSDAKDTWIVEGMGFPVINLPMMVGAPTINSTNVYPTLERWHELDPERKYDDIYNRYAHILVNIVEEEASFELIQADYFILNININYLKKLDAKYILTGNDLDNYSNEYI